MSSRNTRKIILKDLFNNNHFNPSFNIIKKITKNNISSIELRTDRKNYLQINLDKNIFNTQNRNKSNKIKNSKQLSIPDICRLNKTPEKDEKKENTFIKENYSAQQNKKISIPEISNRIKKSSIKILPPNINKLPLILKNDYKTLKFNAKTNINETIDKQEHTDREESSRRYIKQIPSINISQMEKINEMKNRMNKDINKNVCINIINYNKICIKKELKPVKIISKLNLNDSKKSENSELKKLKHHMKDRFYMDTEAKMNKKLKDKVFSHDHSLKDKIIEMNQIGEFWGGVIDYCNPVFTIKKFGYLKKKYNQNKKKRENSSEGRKKFEIVSAKKKDNKNVIKSMRLFTINSYLDYKRQKKLETRKEFLEKYNDSLKYYIL